MKDNLFYDSSLKVNFKLEMQVFDNIQKIYEQAIQLKINEEDEILKKQKVEHILDKIQQKEIETK